MGRGNPSRPGRVRLFRHGIAHADQVVSDDTETDPALHAGLTSIAAAAKPVSALDHADAPLTPRSPFLAVAEPALLLLAPARRTLRGAIGYAHPLDTFGLSRGLILGGVEARIRGDQTRRAPQHGFMRCDGWDQQVRVGGALIVDLLDHLRPTATPHLPMVLASAILAIPMRVNMR